MIDISQYDEDLIDMLETSIHSEVWIENLPKLDKLCLDIYIEITYICLIVYQRYSILSIETFRYTV